MTETVHSDFEPIERDAQNYRISTRVEYHVAGQYQCEARLMKSHNGRILDVKRDTLYTSSGVTSHKSQIDHHLANCIRECRDKLDEIEEAKDIDIDVDIGDTNE